LDAGDGFMYFSGPNFSPFITRDVSSISTFDGEIRVNSDLSNLFRMSGNGANFLVLGSNYKGPVSYIERQFIGDRGGQVLFGTKDNDFIRMNGGTNAVNGGSGDDVLDGGEGSNFLTGGEGTDIFFLDGRGGGVTWSTITDWRSGEQLSFWGWRPGVSKAMWIDVDGAEGYRGVTLHADLNGNGDVDASVTWSGKARWELPLPIAQDGLLWFIG
jgi:serralysin